MRAYSQSQTDSTICQTMLTLRQLHLPNPQHKGTHTHTHTHTHSLTHSPTHLLPHTCRHTVRVCITQGRGHTFHGSAPQLHSGMGKVPQKYDAGWEGMWS